MVCAQSSELKPQNVSRYVKQGKLHNSLLSGKADEQK